MERNTVFENVAFALRAVERPYAEIKMRVPAMLERVGLAGRENDNVMHLSGGEQQRVAVARAIINNPLVLFADEPTGDLDPKTSDELIQLFADINAEGTTLVMATHDQIIVDKMQKRVITLDLSLIHIYCSPLGSRGQGCSERAAGDHCLRQQFSWPYYCNHQLFHRSVCPYQLWPLYSRFQDYPLWRCSSVRAGCHLSLIHI